jgi:hypothetical protein
MAVMKVLSHNKTTAGTRQLLAYVLDPKKTEPHLCAVTGDFRDDDVTPQTVYRNYARAREQYNNARAGGRICTHGTVSFAPGEIAPEQAAEFATAFVERIYPNHQVLTATHTDTGDRIHFHYVVNTVSYVDGSMLHTSKHDLVRAKQICNEMCRERGLSVAQKGRHADGSAFAEGEVTAWDKNKWHQMKEDPKQSYLVELALAVQDCMAAAESREEFCDTMEHEYGWIVTWKDSKKNIVFTSSDGKRVRDSNLSKTFNLNISKEALCYEFARNSGRTTPEPGSTEKAPTAATADLPIGSREQVAERAAGKGKRKQ